MRWETKEPQEIIEFLKEENRTASGNVTYPTQRERALSYRHHTITGKEGKIVATMGTATVPCVYRLQGPGEQSDREEVKQCNATYANFLCVRSALRHLPAAPLAMTIIAKAVDDSYQRCCLFAYQLTAQRHQKWGAELRTWYRPLSVREARQGGYVIPSRQRRGERGNCGERLYYDRLPASNFQQVDATEERREERDRRSTSERSEEVRRFLLRQGERMTVAFVPSAEEWAKWCTTYPTYFNGRGLFSLSFLNVVIGEKINLVAYVVLFAGEGLDGCLAVAKERGAVVVYFYQVGDATEEVLRGAKALLAEGVIYLEFYNFGFVLDAKRVMLPLF